VSNVSKTWQDYYSKLWAANLSDQARKELAASASNMAASEAAGMYTPYRDAGVGLEYNDMLADALRGIDRGQAPYMSRAIVEAAEAKRDELTNNPYYTRESAIAPQNKPAVRGGGGFRPVGEVHRNPPPGTPVRVNNSYFRVDEDPEGQDAPSIDWESAGDFTPTMRVGNTPFADAYFRAREKAQSEGPATSLLKKFME